MSAVAKLAQFFYPELQNRWDDTLFRRSIDTYVKSNTHVLDLGAGLGIIPQMNLRGSVVHVAGLDPDSCVLGNPFLDEARVGSGESIPWPSGRFDLVIANNVLEHLAEPLRVFREVARVLKSGGLFLVKTPNRLHYVALVSILTPYRFHRWFQEKHGSYAEDVYPTFYRANTRRTIERLARSSGFSLQDCSLFEGRPEYLRSTTLTYLLGIGYERLVNSTELLSDFRVVLTAALRKV